MTKYDHWASEEAMKETIDSWSDEMKEAALRYLKRWEDRHIGYFKLESARIVDAQPE